MTAPARITQADVERATKAVAKAGLRNARIIMDLEARRIEIIIGDAAKDDAAIWADDDV